MTGDTFDHPVRCIRGPFVRRLEGMEREGVSETEFLDYGAGRLRAAIVDGDLKEGSVMAGQSAGLVADLVSVQELIDRIVAEAGASIRRCASLLAS